MVQTRNNYSNAEKQWWKDEFMKSGFDSRNKFLTHVGLQIKAKVKSGTAGMVKKKNYTAPAIGTFDNWFRAQNSAKIAANKTSKKKKNRQPMHPVLENLVLDYIRHAQTKLSQYGLGISWSLIQTRAKKFAQLLKERGIMSDAEFDSFKCSRGYIDRLRKRHQLKVIKMVGEANTISEEDLETLISAFRVDLQGLMEEHNVAEDCVFNADQTGLYFKRFPCTTIAEASKAVDLKGTKAMKDKDRITTMVCTSSTGKKVPMAYVGKSKNPFCFRGHEIQNYCANDKAWFNMSVTQWWFREVFAPFFVENHRQEEEKHCIVILDGCSAHNKIQEWLDTHGLSWIHVITLPPNVTSRFQPMDQGVIAWTKKSYKYMIISELLDIYDDEENMEAAVASRRGRGYNGIDQGCKPHVRDAIERINKIWNDMPEESIKKCWRKATCMPIAVVEDAAGVGVARVGVAGGLAGENGIDVQGGVAGAAEENGIDAQEEGEEGNINFERVDEGETAELAERLDVEVTEGQGVELQLGQSIFDETEIDNGIADNLDRLRVTITQGIHDAHTRNEIAGTYILNSDVSAENARDIVAAWIAQELSEPPVAVEETLETADDEAESACLADIEILGAAKQLETISEMEVRNGEEDDQDDGFGIEDDEMCSTCNDEIQVGVGAAVEPNFAELNNGDPLEAVVSIQRNVEYLQRLMKRILSDKMFEKYNDGAKVEMKRLEILLQASNQCCIKAVKIANSSKVEKRKQSQMTGFFQPVVQKKK